MKNAAYAAVMAACILIAAGCATTNFREEPVGGMGTLVIGQVHVEITDWPSQEMNGVHKRNIQVFLYDIGEKEQIQVLSREDGAFYIVFPNTKKQIFLQGFVVKGMTRKGTSTVTVKYGKRVILYPGKVNNVGCIVCKIHTASISKKRTTRTEYDIIQNVEVDYEDIRQWFQLTFPDSAWNDKEWERVLHYKL